MVNVECSARKLRAGTLGLYSSACTTVVPCAVHLHVRSAHHSDLDLESKVLCSMSRLNLSDQALYARYERGELDSDLNLYMKAASSEQGVRVSKSALIGLSDLLGDMANCAVTDGSNVLPIKELSQDS